MWFFLSQHKHSASLIFCIFFSFSLLFWQAKSFNLALAYFGYFSSRLGVLAESSSSLLDFYWLRLGGYQELELAYSRARQQLDESRLEEDKFAEVARENEQLRNLLGYTDHADYQETNAEILSVRNDAISPRLIIGKGASSGITPFMPVLAAAIDEKGNVFQAVLGLVVAVFEDSCLVQPVTHPDFRIGVRLIETGAWAILLGNSGNPNELRVQYIVSKARSGSVLMSQENEQEILPNSRVMTSGNAGIFPRGLPVGEVVRMGPRRDGFQTAYVRPYAPIYKLDHVTVILKEREKWSANNEKAEQEWLDYPESEFGPIIYDERTIRNQKSSQTTAGRKSTQSGNAGNAGNEQAGTGASAKKSSAKKGSASGSGSGSGNANARGSGTSKDTDSGDASQKSNRDRRLLRTDL